MVITQLQSPIPLHTPKGFAMAHLVIDYGMDHDLQWVTFIVETGECWTFRNQDVRLVDNETMGRKRATIEPCQSKSVRGLNSTTLDVPNPTRG